MKKQEYLPSQDIHLNEVHYVEDELILVSAESHFQQTIPHYINLINHKAEPTRHFGNATLDGLLLANQVKPLSISRVFIAENDVKNLLIRGKNIREFDFCQNYSDEENIGKFSRTFILKIEDYGPPLEILCQKLMESPAIEEAYPNYLSEIASLDVETFYDRQWSLAAIQGNEIWDLEPGLNSVKIAIPDTGMDIHHPNLFGKWHSGYDFIRPSLQLTKRFRPLGLEGNVLGEFSDTHGHGTQMAGIMAANHSVKQGIKGLARDCKLLPLRALFSALDQQQQKTVAMGCASDVDAALKFAIDAGAELIYLGFTHTAQMHRSVLEYAYNKNVCLVGAVGNHGSQKALYPAAYKKVLAVGATTPGLDRAAFSNFGKDYFPMVMAPGENIISLNLPQQYGQVRGTSAAAAMVCGLCALLISVAKRKKAKYSPDDIYRIICQTCIPPKHDSHRAFWGDGLVQAKEALQLAQSTFL